jgi:hypothetical protein
MEDPHLQVALEKLAEADIVLVRGLPPESDYRFKHALIQDAAYENLLKSRRLMLHRRVAEILRDRFTDTASAEPEMLAHHFTQANAIKAGIEWWQELASGHWSSQPLPKRLRISQRAFGSRNHCPLVRIVTNVNWSSSSTSGPR